MINDDEAVVFVSPTTLTISEGDDVTYTVALNTEPSQTAATDLRGFANTDATVSTSSLTFADSNRSQQADGYNHRRPRCRHHRRNRRHHPHRDRHWRIPGHCRSKRVCLGLGRRPRCLDHRRQQQRDRGRRGGAHVDTGGRHELGACAWSSSRSGRRPSARGRHGRYNSKP